LARLIIARCVENELWEIWEFIARDNQDAATRVIAAARETFRVLAENPGMGTRRHFRNRRLRDVRSWQVSGFENYIIFYRGVADGIEVIHVYHRARDIDSLFDEE
jgi:toxin ParE1/3/4